MRDSWIHEQETAGIKSNRNRTFTLTLSGEHVYDLLHILETDAVKAESFAVVRHCVLLQDDLFAQLKKQGF